MRTLSALALAICVSLLLVQGGHGTIPAPALRLTLGSEWALEDDSDWGLLDQSWTLADDSRVFASLMTHGNGAADSRPSQGSMSKFLEEFTRGRRAVLAWQGIADWKIQSHDLKETKDRTILTIRGGYHDVDEDPVRFEEVHVFEGPRYTVFSVIYPEDSDFAASGKAVATLDHFTASVVKGANQ